MIRSVIFLFALISFGFVFQHFSVLAIEIKPESTAYCRFDLNHDGVINIRDFAILKVDQGNELKSLVSLYQKYFGKICDDKEMIELDKNNDKLITVIDFALAKNELQQKQAKIMTDFQANFGRICMQATNE